MSTITVRLNKDEEELFFNYSEFLGIPLSTLLKKSLEEKIEDELDLKFINEYEKNKLNKKFKSHNEVKKMFGLENEI